MYTYKYMHACQRRSLPEPRLPRTSSSPEHARQLRSPSPTYEVCSASVRCRLAMAGLALCPRPRTRNLPRVACETRYNKPVASQLARATHGSSLAAEHSPTHDPVPATSSYINHLFRPLGPQSLQVELTGSLSWLQPYPLHAPQLDGTALRWRLLQLDPALHSRGNMEHGERKTN